MRNWGRVVINRPWTKLLGAQGPEMKITVSWGDPLFVWFVLGSENSEY